MIIISLYRQQKKKKKNLMIMCVDILEWLACPSGPERYAGDSSSLHMSNLARQVDVWKPHKTLINKRRKLQ